MSTSENKKINEYLWKTNMIIEYMYGLWDILGMRLSVTCVLGTVISET